MAIDFTLTEEQNKLQTDARNFAQNVLAPDMREVDAGWTRCAGSSSPRTRSSFLFDPKAGGE